MSTRTRHAAELAARLYAAYHAEDRLESDGEPAVILGFGRIAQDVDKLLRLSASLR